MGILRDSSNNERSASSLSKDESRQEGSLNNSRQQGTQELEAKREEFRKYLERSGVLDALTKVLVLLYEETDKPDDALDYICKYLSNATESKSEVESLKKELESAKDQIAELEAKLEKCDLDVPSV